MASRRAYTNPAMRQVSRDTWIEEAVHLFLSHHHVGKLPSMLPLLIDD